jgi:hypothetical protein
MKLFDDLLRKWRIRKAVKILDKFLPFLSYLVDKLNKEVDLDPNSERVKSQLMSLTYQLESLSIKLHSAWGLKKWIKK